MTDNDDVRSQKLNQVIADYRADMRSGHEPNREKLYDEHPDFADELASFFEAERAFEEDGALLFHRTT